MEGRREGAMEGTFFVDNNLDGEVSILLANSVVLHFKYNIQVFTYTLPIGF